MGAVIISDMVVAVEHSAAIKDKASRIMNPIGTNTRETSICPQGSLDEVFN